MQCQARGTYGQSFTVGYSYHVFALEAPCTFIPIRATRERMFEGLQTSPSRQMGEWAFHFQLRQLSSPRVIQRHSGKCPVSSVTSYLPSRGLGNSERLNSRPLCQTLQCFSLTAPSQYLQGCKLAPRETGINNV